MRRPLCLLCLFYVLGVVLILNLFPAFDREEEQLQDGKSSVFSGEVYRMEAQKDRSVLYLKASLTGSPGFRAVCYVDDTEILSRIKIGNRVSVKGTCRLFDEASNDGQFDGRMYYRIQEISCYMTGCRVFPEDSGFRPYEQGLFVVRRYMSRILENSLPQKYAGIMQAMFLGDAGGMEEEIRELFQRNGISHILAISGLHISFLGMGIFRLLKKLKIPSFMKAALTAVFVISFGVMTGQSVSAVRSVVMFLLFLAAGLCGRTYDMLTAAAFSCVVLLLKQPLYIYHSGFLLSFGAVTGMALLVPAIDDVFPKEPAAENMILNQSVKERTVRKLKKKCRSAFTASLSVSLATLPIQLIFFYTFPPYSVFLNLFVLPLVGALMAAGALGLLGSCIIPALGPVFMMPCVGILSLCEGLCRLFDRLPGGNPVLGKPKPWQTAVYYGILFLFVYGKRKSGKKRNILILFAGVFLLCIRVRGATSLTMLDIGQGDCMVIEEKSGYNVLVDGGSSDVGNVGQYRILPYLKSRGIDCLDYIFVSHADSDHISGILEILSEEGKEKIGIRHLVLTGYAVKDPAYGELLAYANRLGIKVLYVGEGDRFEIGNTFWECIYPAMDDTGEGNDQSMVLLMECGGTGTLFTGDLPGEREERILEKAGSGNVQILKTAHHGSRYSTTESFLQGCRPKTAIISAGRDNPYGHPHKETLKRLEDAGCRVYGTYSGGAVTVRYGKRKYSVLTYKKM